MTIPAACIYRVSDIVGRKYRGTDTLSVAGLDMLPGTCHNTTHYPAGNTALLSHRSQRPSESLASRVYYRLDLFNVDRFILLVPDATMSVVEMKMLKIVSLQVVSLGLALCLSLAFPLAQLGNHPAQGRDGAFNDGDVLLVFLEWLLLQRQNDVDIISEVFLKVRQLALVEPCFVVADFNLAHHVIGLHN